MKCRELMETAVEFCAPGDSAAAVAARMQSREVGFIPVCDSTGRVLGVVTDRDLALRVVATARDPATTLASEVMSRHPVACAPDDDLVEAERLMAAHKKGRILCVDSSGSLVGVISLTDIAQVEDQDRVFRLLRAIATREACFVVW